MSRKTDEQSGATAPDLNASADDALADATGAAAATSAVQVAPAEPVDPDDGTLYRIGAPWAGMTRYECATPGCPWDTLDRDSAIEHYVSHLVPEPPPPAPAPTEGGPF